MKGDEGERKSKEREISFPGKKDAIFATSFTACQKQFSLDFYAHLHFIFQEQL